MIKGYCREVCVGLGGRYRVLVSEVWMGKVLLDWVEKGVHRGLERLYCEAVL